MGIFDIFRSRDKPANRTAGGFYNFFMGQTSSGKRVNERSAMQITAVYSCVRILSEAVASLPLHLYRYTDAGGKEKAIDLPLCYNMYEFLVDSGKKLRGEAQKISREVIESFAEVSNPNTAGFMRRLEDMDQIYNKTTGICFDKDNLYLVAG